MRNQTRFKYLGKTQSKKIQWVTRLSHLALLLLIFVGPEIPFTMSMPSKAIRFVAPMCYIGVFYLNYNYLTDRFLFHNKRIMTYTAINLVLIIAVVSLFYYIFYTQTNPITMPPPKGPFPPPEIPPEELMRMHFIRALSMLPRISVQVIMAIALSIAIKLSENWIKWQRKESEMKSQIQENELKNLKNQFNPHFLFNTLNNIYALIPISQDKAQKSVHELSQLLRHTLYNNEEREVPLEKELHFINNYISLMRLRLNNLVTLNVDINEQLGAGKLIAPMLFISLIENAFKHGVSSDKKSFIDISIRVDKNSVLCRVENSYFPKSNKDKSGSGIGIVNLKRQLDIIYPERHSFDTRIDNGHYIATLFIQLTTSSNQYKTFYHYEKSKMLYNRR